MGRQKRRGLASGPKERTVKLQKNRTYSVTHPLPGIFFLADVYNTLLYAVPGIIHPGTRVIHTYQVHYEVCRIAFYFTFGMYLFLLRVRVSFRPKTIRGQTHRYTGTVHGISRNLLSACVPPDISYILVRVNVCSKKQRILVRRHVDMWMMRKRLSSCNTAVLIVDHISIAWI